MCLCAACGHRNPPRAPFLFLQIALGTPYPCTSPQDFHWLLPGAWQLRVGATDAAGNSASPLRANWTVAFSAGLTYVRLLSGPYGRTRRVNMTYELAALRGADGGAAAGASIECWLQGGGSASPAYAPCTSPFDLPASLADGQYTFYARLAGSASDNSTAASSTFTLDSVPPVVSITSAPSAPLTTSSASLQFAANKAGSTFRCRVAGPGSGGSAGYQPCSSPLSLANLTDGPYAFSVYAVDDVGNVGAPANATFLVDTHPPFFDSISYPLATNRTSVTVTFVADDGPVGCVARPAPLPHCQGKGQGLARASWLLLCRWLHPSHVRPPPTHLHTHPAARASRT